MVTVNEILDTLDTEGLGVVDGNEITALIENHVVVFSFLYTRY